MPKNPILEDGSAKKACPQPHPLITGFEPFSSPWILPVFSGINTVVFIVLFSRILEI